MLVSGKGKYGKWVNVARFGKISCPDLTRSWLCCQSEARQAFLIPYYRPANSGHGDSMEDGTLTSCKIFCKFLSLCHCRRPKQIRKWKACCWSMVFCSKIQRVRPWDRTKKRLPSHVSGKSVNKNSANGRNVIQGKMPTVTSGLCACDRSIPCRGCLVRNPLLIQSELDNLTKHIGHAFGWCSQCVLKVALHPSNLSPAKAQEIRY